MGKLLYALSSSINYLLKVRTTCPLLLSKDSKYAVKLKIELQVQIPIRPTIPIDLDTPLVT